SDAPSDWLKTDISEVDQDAVVVSARTGAGLDGLRSQVVDRLTGREPLQDAPMISNLRHLRHVDSAVEAMGRASRALGMGATEELVLAELAHARAALEAIVGRRSPEDLLRHIFA